jgi:hypothetical protein
MQPNQNLQGLCLGVSRPEILFLFQMQIDPENVAYAQDEYGRPFIIVRDQKKTRIKGLEAQKVSIV